MDGIFNTTGVILSSEGPDSAPTYTVSINMPDGPVVIAGVVPCGNRPPVPLLIQRAKGAFHATFVGDVLQAHIREYPQVTPCTGDGL